MTNLLIGKNIVDVKIAEDKEAMLFVTSEGDNLIVRVDADCCSHTWIETVEMPALGLPFTVISCDDLDMGKEPEDIDYEYVQYYGAKITTDKGELVIDYRNSSNGYYGGSVVWPGEDYFYGGVYGQNVSDCVWVEIAK
ncbi:hypothetical protein NQI61_003275 [Salmonella enterica]|nr:hypothetical protein [Salmonella enterica subsp. enterica]EDQ9876422.1 hypothetical protein [Salmonella enterica subsp. enterica]EJN6148203.1 hypothetical protein [Salmonella enterica]ELP9742203.1 hypothetical protein [Salmonella enterica]